MDKALCVGINKYISAPLNGCVNDVVDMANFLVDKMGFSRDSIRLIVDDRATASAILERLEWLVRDIQAGDRVVFHFSGHGVQVATRNPKEEIDGLDECICGVDFNWSDETMIRDKQFVEIFSKLPSGVKFNWFSDSCHSGSSTRNPIVARTYPVPADMAWRKEVAKDKNIIATGIKGIVNDELEVGFISGCKDNQTSADTVIDGKPCGAFTHMLLKCLNNGGKDLPLTKLAEAVTMELKEAHFSQEPQAEGTRKDKPFLV